MITWLTLLVPVQTTVVMLPEPSTGVVEHLFVPMGRASSLQSARFGAGDGAVSRQELAQKDKRVRVLEGQLKRLQQQYEVGPAGGKAGRNESRNRKQSSDPMVALIEASRPTEATEAVLRKLACILAARSSPGSVALRPR